MNKKHKNIITFKVEVKKKLTSLGYYINAHSIVNQTPRQVLPGNAHLAEFDRSTGS